MRKFYLVTAIVLLAGCASQQPRSDEPVKLADKPYCLHETGTRVGEPKQRCEPGQKYDRADLERSGGATLGDSLKQLTPR